MTERVARECLSLPIYAELSEEQLSHVAQTIRALLHVGARIRALDNFVNGKQANFERRGRDSHAVKSGHKKFAHVFLRPSLGSVRYAHEKGQQHVPVRTAHATQGVPVLCGPI